VLTIEQLEANRRKAIADAEKSARDQAARDAKNTNLAKFLVNVESRIYAQLSKQLADAMFSDGANSGEMDFQGTNINWVKTGTDVTLTISITGVPCVSDVTSIISFTFNISYSSLKYPEAVTAVIFSVVIYEYLLGVLLWFKN
jgi:hypothetical protein